MNILFYLILSLLLIILETVVMPCFQMFGRFYDLLIPFVLYLGLYRPVREGLPFVLLLGFMVDCLSGGPSGLFLTIYFWLFILTRWIVTFLHAGNKWLWIISVAIGVLVEDLIIIATLNLLGDSTVAPAQSADRVVGQLLWALCTGPVFITGIGWAQRWWGERIFQLAFRIKEQRV